MELLYWLVRLFIRREGDGVKGVILASLGNHFSRVPTRKSGATSKYHISILTTKQKTENLIHLSTKKCSNLKVCCVDGFLNLGTVHYCMHSVVNYIVQ